MVSYVTVTGTIEKPTGDPSEAGDIVFTPERFSDPDDKVIVPEIGVTATPDPVTGQFSITLLRSVVIINDPYVDVYTDTYGGSLASAPTHYRVSEPAGEDYCIQLLSTSPSPLLLNDAVRC